MAVSEETLAKSFPNWQMNEIPENWYIPARTAYSMLAQILYHWKRGAKLAHGAATADYALSNAWEIFEDRAIQVGGTKDGTEKGESV